MVSNVNLRPYTKPPSFDAAEDAEQCKALTDLAERVMHEVDAELGDGWRVEWEGAVESGAT